MKSFLFPSEGVNSGWRYLLTLLIVLVGVILFGSLMSLVVMLTKFPLSELANLEDSLINFSKNEMLVMNLIPFACGVLFFWISAKFLLKRPLKSLITARVRIDWKRFVVALLVWGVVLIGTSLLSYFSNPDTIQWNFKAETFYYLVLIALIGIPFQTLFEELLLRGLFLQLGAKFIPKGIVNICFSACLFGALHLANPEISELGYAAVVYYILCGIFEGIIAVMDNGAELAWGFHFANNFFAVVFFNTTWGALPTDSLFLDLSAPSFSWNVLFTPLIIYPIVLFAFAKIYKWSDWKSKLF